MTTLSISPAARGTLVEALHKLVDASGLVITVQGTERIGDIKSAIARVAPRLVEKVEVRANGLIVSEMAQYRVIWGVVQSPGGSLAVLTPHSLYENQKVSDWSSFFRVEVLDPIVGLASQGYSTGSGGNGTVSEPAFADAFANAYA
ncbi:hypothetical protein [Amycolatopsis sp. CB00013]|uniref:hypothetical protein n=1 Tax=Amycolatopsis sp. CB00013 TaxID=1703945 RepID=UPI00093A30C7|nr:hypothetical protein [Amycolatopsis sp. CB00013]OKJ95673.1 hypothetical protein AMK34_21970 [Amycolatopsis sp. CB00013]